MFTRHLDVMYTSSRERSLNLCMDVYLPNEPGPIVLLFHGWHGTRKNSRKKAQWLARRYVVVNVDMRGRGKSDGQPDVNGWELLDGVDAVRYVQRHYAEHISDPRQVYCFGASGGGGNVYALVAKFPDMFAAGVVLCGISDYAAWYDGDDVGEFRDEMDVWIGQRPDEAPDAYRKASGLHLMENVQTPLLIYHGDEDARVPVSMGRTYANRAEKLNKPVTYVELPGVGHDIDPERYIDDIFSFYDEHKQPPRLPAEGRLIVGGYVQTESARIELDSINAVATMTYATDDDGKLDASSMTTDGPSFRFVPLLDE